MSKEIGELFVKFRAELDALEADLQKGKAMAEQAGKDAGQKHGDAFTKGLKDKLDSVGSKFTTYGQALTLGVSAPLVLAANHALGLSAAFEESRETVKVTFGAMSKDVETFVERQADSWNISKRQAMAAASDIGGILKGSGIKGAAAEMSIELVKLGGDLAAFKKIDVGDAMKRLAGGLTGELGSLKELGIVMSDAEVKAKGMSLGIAGAKGQMDDQAKTIARYMLMLEKTSAVQGYAAKTAGTLSEREKEVKRKIDDLEVTIGKKFIPVKQKLLEVTGEVVGAVGGWIKNNQGAATTIGVIAMALGPASMLIGGLARTTSAIIGMRNAWLGVSAAAQLASSASGAAAAAGAGGAAASAASKSGWGTAARILGKAAGVGGLILAITQDTQGFDYYTGAGDTGMANVAQNKLLEDYRATKGKLSDDVREKRLIQKWNDGIPGHPNFYKDALKGYGISKQLNFQQDSERVSAAQKKRDWDAMMKELIAQADAFDKAAAPKAGKGPNSSGSGKKPSRLSGAIDDGFSPMKVDVSQWGLRDGVPSDQALAMRNTASNGIGFMPDFFHGIARAISDEMTQRKFINNANTRFELEGWYRNLSGAVADKRSDDSLASFKRDQSVLNYWKDLRASIVAYREEQERTVSERYADAWRQIREEAADFGKAAEMSTSRVRDLALSLGVGATESEKFASGLGKATLLLGEEKAMREWRENIDRLGTHMEDSLMNSFHNLRENGFRSFFRDIGSEFRTLTDNIVADWVNAQVRMFANRQMTSLFNTGLSTILGGSGGPSTNFGVIPKVAAAAGGYKGGVIRVGEYGPENVYLPNGSYVETAGQSRESGGMNITINVVVQGNASAETADQIALRVAQELARVQARNG